MLTHNPLCILLEAAEQSYAIEFELPIRHSTDIRPMGVLYLVDTLLKRLIALEPWVRLYAVGL